MCIDVTNLPRACLLDFCIPRLASHYLEEVGEREEVSAVIVVYLTAAKIARARPR